MILDHEIIQKALYWIGMQDTKTMDGKPYPITWHVKAAAIKFSLSSDETDELWLEALEWQKEEEAIKAKPYPPLRLVYSV